MDAVKKISLIAAAISALAFQSSAMAAEGTINFNGTITSAGCKMNGADTFTMTQDFGTVAASAFSGVGSRARLDKVITIKLDNCPVAGPGIDGRKVTLTFTGPTPGTYPNNLVPLNAGGATGVGVGLWKSDGSVVTLGGAAPVVFPYDAGVQGTTITLFADYVSTVDNTTTKIVPGVANTVVSVNATYN